MTIHVIKKVLIIGLEIPSEGNHHLELYLPSGSKLNHHGYQNLDFVKKIHFNSGRNVAWNQISNVHVDILDYCMDSWKQDITCICKFLGKMFHIFFSFCKGFSCQHFSSHTAIQSLPLNNWTDIVYSTQIINHELSFEFDIFCYFTLFLTS